MPGLQQILYCSSDYHNTLYHKHSVITGPDFRTKELST